MTHDDAHDLKRQNAELAAHLELAREEVRVCRQLNADLVARQMSMDRDAYRQLRRALTESRLHAAGLADALDAARAENERLRTTLARSAAGSTTLTPAKTAPTTVEAPSMTIRADAVIIVGGDGLGAAIEVFLDGCGQVAA